MIELVIPGQAERERERDALRQLSHVNGPRELHATLLALLLPASPQADMLAAWTGRDRRIPGAAALREEVAALGGATRLPCFEQFLSRNGQAAAGAAPGAPRIDTPSDARDRHAAPDRSPALADDAHAFRRAGLLRACAWPAHPKLAELAESDVQAVARYSAYLSRMVPTDDGDAGDAWYASVMAPWQERGIVLPRHAPDADALVHALQELQALTWTNRPVLMRNWVVAALQFGRLADSAADALYLSCVLLDSPLPARTGRATSRRCFRPRADGAAPPACGRPRVARALRHGPAGRPHDAQPGRHVCPMPRHRWPRRRGQPGAGLAGQAAPELVEKMKAFKSGARPGSVMPQLAKGYSDARIEQLAAYFAAQPKGRAVKRRSLLQAAVASAALAGCATRPASLPERTRVLVVGGGYGGATAAKYLRLFLASAARRRAGRARRGVRLVPDVEPRRRRQSSARRHHARLRRARPRPRRDRRARQRRFRRRGEADRTARVRPGDPLRQARALAGRRDDVGRACPARSKRTAPAASCRPGRPGRRPRCCGASSKRCAMAACSRSRFPRYRTAARPDRTNLQAHEAAFQGAGARRQ